MCIPESWTVYLPETAAGNDRPGIRGTCISTTCPGFRTSEQRIRASNSDSRQSPWRSRQKVGHTEGQLRRADGDAPESSDRPFYTHLPLREEGGAGLQFDRRQAWF